MWTHEFESGTSGSVLTTAGGLVFGGGRDVCACHALSGRQLWQMRTNYGRAGVPTFYAANTVRTSRASGADGGRDGLVVWAFALDCQC